LELEDRTPTTMDDPFGKANNLARALVNGRVLNIS